MDPNNNYYNQQSAERVNYNPEDYQGSYEQPYVSQDDYDESQDTTDENTNQLIDDAVEEIVMGSCPNGKRNNTPSHRTIVKPSGKISVNPNAGLTEDGNIYLNFNLL